MSKVSILQICTATGRRALIGGVIASLLLTSGCSMMAAHEPDIASRNQALQRWESCVERYTSITRGSVNTVYRDVETLCDGHRRDVAATFPDHLENQVAKRLSQRASDLASTRHVSTDAIEAWADPEGTRIDTFRIRLREAHEGDL